MTTGTVHTSSGTGAAAANRATPSPWRPLAGLCAAALTLRIVVFLSRGDYIAFDEGWYLLLGRNLLDGIGFKLSGLQHTTLSPLFPILAGIAGKIIGDPVWGGRIVAAVSSALLVVPCWFIFNRLADRRVAWAACILIAVTPSMTPFAAPYWIGWDLWVGAEPLMHLLLFAGIAVALRARTTTRPLDWAAAGALFALAHLARTEAVLMFAVIGLMVGGEALLRRDGRRIACALTMALAFAITAAPYWVYLHDALGRWALTGRAVAVTAPRASPDAPGTDQPRGAALTGVEAMLWRNDNRQYVRELYGLDETGTRLRSTYWGVRVRAEPGTETPSDAVGGSADPGVTPNVELEGAAVIALDDAAEDRSGAIESLTIVRNADSGTASTAEPTAIRQPGRWELYARTLGTVLPWFVWPIALIGLAGRRARPFEEALLAAPLIVASIVIARVVGADPRTQLLVVPLVVFYAARAMWLIGSAVEAHSAARGVRPGFAAAAATGVLGLVLVATVAHWVWMGFTMGSPQHTTSAATRVVGEALQEVVPAGEAVMSWHPGVALHADRDWRVLPFASLPAIIRYANAIGAEWVVLSQYYPGSKLIEQLDQDHLVLHVPPAPDPGGQWWIDVQTSTVSHVVAHLRYSSAGAP